jgi:hypothetical protein
MTGHVVPQYNYRAMLSFPPLQPNTRHRKLRTANTNRGGIGGILGGIFAGGSDAPGNRASNRQGIGATLIKQRVPSARWLIAKLSVAYWVHHSEHKDNILIYNEK